MRRKSIFFCIPILLFLISCQNGIIYSNTVNIDEEGWNSEDFVRFELLVDDTSRVYSLDLNVRNDGRYAFSNLFLFITTYAPTGMSIKDTIECTLADKSGKWLGRGVGSQYHHTIPFKKQVVFPFKGKYIIEVEHGMRPNSLAYIRDVGLTIKVEM